ncbi:MAG: NfeD family protein [Spirochaetia bacterium]|nr:NfeD family protein [Spirochaetia bacterium]
MNIWWLFVTVGILLMALEALTPGFIIMWFGIAFIVAAIPVYLNASTQVVLLTFSITLLLLTVFVRKIFLGTRSKHKGPKTNALSLVGEKGVVIEEINSIKATGLVRIHKEVWTAISKKSEVIPVDQVIVVQKIEGVKLIVEKE